MSDESPWTTTDPALLLADLSRRVGALETSSQEAYRSVEGGTKVFHDDDGNVRQVLGYQEGVYTTQDVNEDEPPIPSLPQLSGRPGAYVVSWDGETADGTLIPLNFLRVAVHADMVPDFEPTDETEISSINTATGGSITMSADSVVYYVKFMMMNTSGVESQPTAEVAVTPDNLPSAQDVSSLEVEISDVDSRLGETRANLQDFQGATEATLGTFQSAYDTLTGIGNVGVEEDYMWVGDDPALSTVKAVEISVFMQGLLQFGSADSLSQPDRLNYWPRDVIGDVEYNADDAEAGPSTPPMTAFYQTFEDAGLSPLPWNA